MTTATFTLPVDKAITVFSAVLPHALDSDRASTVMHSIRVDRNDGGRPTVVGTDRFSIGRWTLPALLDGGDGAEAFTGEPFTLHRDAALWIKALKPSALRQKHRVGKTFTDGGYSLRIDADAERHEALVQVGFMDDGEWQTEKSQAFDLIAGNFPPVARLFPKDENAYGEAGQFALSAGSFKKMLASAAAIEKDAALTIRHTSTQNPAKPGPVHVTVSGGDGFDMLVQPNLLLR